MRKLSVILLLIAVYSAEMIGQQSFILSGTITNSESGERLPGVTVFEESTGKGTVSNDEGSYSLHLPKGVYTILFKYVGYADRTITINLNRHMQKDLALREVTTSIDPVLVEAKRADHNVSSTEISVEKLTMKQVERIPVIMGEMDIMKTIQLLPGITSIAEGRSGYIVRGSGIDQNLILMDGMPLYYTSHMQGLYSVFNSDAVNGLTVYKGGIPAHFGGRGASVLDVRMKEGDFNQFRTSVSIGLITSKFSLEVPVLPNKLSVFLAGRSTKLGIGSAHDYIRNNWLAAKSGELDEKGSNIKGQTASKPGLPGESPNGYNFFARNESWMDLNTKVIYKFNAKNSLTLSTYVGRDSALVVGGLTEWGNRAAHLKWSHTFTSSLLSTTSLIRSRYYTDQAGGIYHFSSGITTTGFKQEFVYFLNDKNDIRFGLTSEYQDFNHGHLEDTSQDDAGKFMPPMQGLESALYIENDQRITRRISALYGLRYSLYQRLGPGDRFVFDEESNEPLSSTYFSRYADIMSFHHYLEPRLALTFLMNDFSSLKLSYNRNAQYLRLMTLGAEIQWYDIWMPSTSNIDPMLTDQVAIGYFRNFLEDQIELSAEAYYKNMKGAADFEDGLHNYLVDNLEAYVATGQGRSYGFEISVEKPKGRLTGRISYNVGKAEYQIDVINKGRWYPNMFDRTNSLSVLSSFELTKYLTLSATFLYYTGRPVTLPESYYYVSGIPFPYWEGRNKYRLPDYHRLDLGLKFHPKFMTLPLKKLNRELLTSFEVSLYNIYNRRNVHTIYYSQGGGKSIEDATHLFEPYGVSTYGFMPSFQLNIEF